MVHNIATIRDEMQKTKSPQSGDVLSLERELVQSEWLWRALAFAFFSSSSSSSFSSSSLKKQKWFITSRRYAMRCKKQKVERLSVP